MDYLLSILARNYPLIVVLLFGYCTFRLGAISTILRLRQEAPAWRNTELKLMGWGMLMIALACLAFLFSTRSALGYFLPLGMCAIGIALLAIAWNKRRQGKTA